MLKLFATSLTFEDGTEELMVALVVVVVAVVVHDDTASVAAYQHPSRVAQRYYPPIMGHTWNGSVATEAFPVTARAERRHSWSSAAGGRHQQGQSQAARLSCVLLVVAAPVAVAMVPKDRCHPYQRSAAVCNQALAGVPCHLE